VFGTISEARVMWDMKTGRSRGYGFVTYRDHDDAQKAINAMNGEWLGSRAIRVNWANQKGQPSVNQIEAMNAVGIPLPAPFNHPPFPSGGMSAYETVLGQAPMNQTTVYVGNLTPYTTQADLYPLFLNFGQVVETRMQADRGFAFFRMETHEQATSAIVSSNNTLTHLTLTFIVFIEWL
jgi:nucleolysin TIA-1/TIAR